MEAHQSPDGTLTVTVDDVRWTRWMFGIAAVFALTAVYDMSIGSRGDDRLIGLAGGIATAVVAGIVMRERSRFVFSPLMCTIVWDRTFGYWRRSGTLRFDEVAHVLVQTPIADRGIPSRRICLKTRQGVEIPLTIGFRTDNGDVIRDIGARIRAVVCP